MREEAPNPKKDILSKIEVLLRSTIPFDKGIGKEIEAAIREKEEMMAAGVLDERALERPRQEAEGQRLQKSTEIKMLVDEALRLGIDPNELNQIRNRIEDELK